LQLRRIERVLHCNQGGEDRKQEKQNGDAGRDHRHPRATEGIEDVAVERTAQPTSAAA
jgi:hypothetical protein